MSWLLPLAFLLLLLGVPVGSVVQEALFGRGGLDLSPLWNVLGDPYYRAIARFTVVQAGWSALLSVVLGVFWAFVLARYHFPGKRTLQSLTIVPFVLPAVSLALGFVIAFGRGGVLNAALMAVFGLEEPPLRLLYSLPAIVLAHAFYNAPIVTRLTHAAWERIGADVVEAARALGAGPAWTFLTVTGRLLLPGVLAGGALAFVYSFLSFPIVLTLGGARFATLEVAIYTEAITLRQVEVGAALAFVQIALSLAFTAGVLWLERRVSLPLPGGRARPTVPLLAPRPGNAVLWAALGLLGAFFLAPVAGVAIHSLLDARGGWTLDWYAYIFAPDFNAFIGDAPLDAVRNSLAFGLGTLALALALGVPLAWAIVRRRLRGLGAVAMAPLAISSVALGFGLLRAFAHPALAWLDRGVAVVMAHALLALPFVVRTLVPALRALDPALAEAARSLGAPRRTAFFQVELPLLRTALLAAAAFAFAISIGEMSATLMLAAPGLKTMPVSVYSFLGARLFGAASAMSVLLILITGAAFVLIERGGERAI